METRSTNCFGQALKYWRRHCGMSQNDVAVDADVSVRHVSFIECGKAQPSAAVAARLVDALPLPPLRRKEILALAGVDVDLKDFCNANSPQPNLHATAQRLLDRCDPYPAFIMDRYMNVVQANKTFERFFNGKVFPTALFNERVNIPLTLANTDGLSTCLDNWQGLYLDLVWRIEHGLALHPADKAMREIHNMLRDHSLTSQLLRTAGQHAQSDSELSRLRVTIGNININFIRTSASFWGEENGAPKLFEIQSVLPADEESAAVADPIMEMLAQDSFADDLTLTEGLPEQVESIAV